jgi:ParB/RepB/Spo0J family partition protein
MAKKLLIPKKKKTESDAFDLDSLMGKTQISQADAVAEVKKEFQIPEGAFVVEQISVDSIVADPDQPRNTQKLTDEYLAELGDSIKRVGQIYPVIVRKNPNKKGSQEWMLVDGECRWLGVKQHKDLHSLNCIVLNDDLDLTDILIMQVAANNKRAEMSIADNAIAYARIEAGLKKQGSNQEEIAAELGMHRVTLSKYTRLARKENLGILKISEEGHSQDLSALIGLAGINDKSPEIARELISNIMAGNAPTDLRAHVTQVLKGINDTEKGANKVKVTSAAKPKVYKPSNVSLIDVKGVSTLSLDVKGKSVLVDLTDIADELKALFN